RTEPRPRRRSAAAVGSADGERANRQVDSAGSAVLVVDSVRLGPVVRRTGRCARAVTSTEPARPTITPYGASKCADNCSSCTPASRGAARKYAVATSSGPTPPEIAVLTRLIERRATGQAATAPIASAAPNDTIAPGQ